MKYLAKKAHYAGIFVLAGVIFFMVSNSETAISTDSVLIDIRTPEEFALGALDGAINIDYYDPTFIRQLDALDRSLSYTIYCRSGSRSSDALGIMRSMGFTVEHIPGGIISLSN